MASSCWNCGHSYNHNKLSSCPDCDEKYADAPIFSRVNHLIPNGFDDLLAQEEKETETIPASEEIPEIEQHHDEVIDMESVNNGELPF